MKNIYIKPAVRTSVLNRLNILSGSLEFNKPTTPVDDVILDSKQNSIFQGFSRDDEEGEE